MTWWGTGLGPRCSCDMDNNYHPGDFNCGCRVGEQEDSCATPGNCSSGHCEPCTFCCSTAASVAWRGVVWCGVVCSKCGVAPLRVQHHTTAGLFSMETVLGHNGLPCRLR